MLQRDDVTEVRFFRYNKRTVPLLTDMPVKEVAYRIGFNDQSYFIRMYRKVTGTTPQEYRKQQGLS